MLRRVSWIQWKDGSILRIPSFHIQLLYSTVTYILILATHLKDVTVQIARTKFLIVPKSLTLQLSLI